jgi:hypothetical protein
MMGMNGAAIGKGYIAAASYGKVGAAATYVCVCHCCGVGLLVAGAWYVCCVMAMVGTAVIYIGIEHCSLTI